MNSQELIDSFEHDLSIRNVSTMCAYCYRRALINFDKFLSERDRDFLSLSKSDLRDYIEVLRQRDLSTKTVSNNLVALASFYDFLVFEELLSFNPVKAIRKRYLSSYKTDSETHTHKIISIEEATRLVNSLVDIRDKAIVLLLLKTGIRRRELIAIDIEDINWKDQSILLKTTKKRSNRTIYFDDETAEVLRRWLRAREMRESTNDNKALFIGTKGRLERNGIDRLVRKAALKLNFHDPGSDQMENHFSPHCCRHFFTTHLIRAGMPRDYVKELRGDVRHDAIDLYNHIDKEELRESYLAHIPQLGI